MNNIRTYFQRLQSGAILMLLTGSLQALGMGFASLYFTLQGLELFKIVLVWAIGPAVGAMTVWLCRTYYIKRFLIIGLLLSLVQVAALLWYTEYSYILFAVSAGIGLAVYWVSLNYIFFTQSSLRHHAKDSSVYFLIGPVLGIVLPPVGAILIGALGYHFIFGLVGVLVVIPLWYVVRYIPEHRITAPIRIAIQRYAGLKLISAIEGALHFFRTFIKIYVLIFIMTEYEIGAFSSYLAIIGFAVSVLLARYSDQKQKRSELLTPFFIVMGLLIIVLGLITESAGWFVLVGVFTFVDTITLPIRFALRMDYKEKDLGFWKASEVFENIGRTVVLGLAGLCLYLDVAWIAFSLFALLAFGYPLVLKYTVRKMQVVAG